MNFSIQQQLAYELKSIFLGYPEFVYSKKVSEKPAGLPVFVFHSIKPTLFEAQLVFLKENGYSTLSVNEFVSCLEKGKRIERKSVLLTVDDARSSFWRFGFPLLAKYEMKATLFVIPGRTLEASSCRRNLSDVWGGQNSYKEVLNSDRNDNTLCTWPELQKMYHSGYVDIESHTLFHKEVFVSDRLIDFVDENTLMLPYNSALTPYFGRDEIGMKIESEKYYGFPLFQSAPLMQGKPAVKVASETVEFCHHFFLQKKEDTNWKKALKNELAQNGFGKKLVYQKSSEVLPALIEDMRFAKEIIQRKIDQEAGNHLCLPYTAGSQRAIEAAKKAGMKSCFWGTLKGRRKNRPGDNPFYIVRLKNDFIWRLPGHNRKSLFNVYMMKVRRRADEGPGY